MNDYAAFYREIAALEREASRGQRRQRRSGAAWERTPEANAQPEERQEPEWSAALRSARVAQGMPAEATDRPLDPVALARLRGETLEQRYSPLNEDWGWLDLPAGLAVATGETFVDSLASPFSEGARQRNEVRRQMLRNAGGGLADALDSWTLDNPGSRDWGTRSNFWEDRQGATNLNELVSGSPGRERRADVQQTLADMDARSRGVWVEPDMTVTADSRPSALRRLGAMGSDIWRGPSDAAREGRRMYPVYLALAEQARGAGDNAAAEDYERAARGAALADAANTGSGALEAAPGIGAIDAVLGVGRFTGRQGLRAAGREIPYYMNPVDWSPTAAYAGRADEAMLDPGLLTRQAEPIRHAVMAAPVGAIATDQLMDGDAGDANQLAGGALLTAGAITGAPMALRGAGDFVRRRLGGADPLADIAPRAEAGAARELDNGARVYEDGYARTTVAPDGSVSHSYQGGLESGGGSGGEAVASMRSALRALERDIQETGRTSYNWTPGLADAPDARLADFYRNYFRERTPPGYVFSESADGTMHLNRVVDAEAAPAPERNFEAALRERAGRGRQVRIGEQVNGDGTVTPRSEIDWENGSNRLPADDEWFNTLAGMPTPPRMNIVPEGGIPGRSADDMLRDGPDAGSFEAGLHLRQDDAGNWFVADRTGERQSEHIFGDEIGARAALSNMRSGLPEMGEIRMLPDGDFGGRAPTQLLPDGGASGAGNVATPLYDAFGNQVNMGLPPLPEMGPILPELGANDRGAIERAAALLRGENTSREATYPLGVRRVFDNHGPASEGFRRIEATREQQFDFDPQNIERRRNPWPEPRLAVDNPAPDAPNAGPRRLGDDTASALAVGGVGGGAVGLALEGEAQADNGSGSDGVPMLPVLGAGAGAATLAALSRGRLGQGARSQVGMFAGVNARTADRAALARAQEMATSGASRESIWQETGWFQGVDGKWRFEIDDSGAQIAPDMLARHSGGSVGSSQRRPLSEGLQHPELNDAYDLSDTTLDFGRLSRGAVGEYDNSRRSISMYAADDPDMLRSGTLHETQHRVQREEGFATGGTPESAWGVNEQASLDAIRAQKKEALGGRDPYAIQNRIAAGYRVADEDMAALEQWRALTRQEDEILANTLSPREAYRRLGGETEARNVQTRRDFTPEERRARPPWETQDVPDDQQIVRFDGDRAESRPSRRLGGSGFDSSVNPERGPVSGGQTGTEAVPDLPPVEQTRTNVPRGAPAGARDYLNRRNARILELIEEMQPVRNARSGAANPNARMGERLDNGYRAIAERLREESYGEVTHNVIKGVVNRSRGRAQTATAEAASAGADEAAAQRLGMSVERYRALSARKRKEAIAAIGVTSAGGLLLANDAEAEGFDPNGRWVGEERQRDMGDGRVELRQRFIDSEGRAYDGVRYRTQDPQTGEVRVSAPQFTPLDEIAAPQLGDTYDTTEVPLRPEEIERIQAMRDEESRRHGLTPDQERSDVAASGDETTPPWALGLPLVTGVIGGRVGRRLGAARGQPLVGETTGALTVGGVTGAGAGAFTEADDIGELVTFGAALGGGGRAAYRGGQEGLRRGAEALADVRMPAPRRVRGQPLPYVGDDLSAAAPPGSLRPPPARQPDRVSGSLDEGDLAREMSGRAIEVGRRRVRPTPVAMEERMNIPAGARGSLEGRLQTLGAEPLRELARREGLSTDGTVRDLASRLAEAARADPARIQRYRDIFQALGVSGVILGGAMQLLPENAEANAMEDWAEGVDWQNVGVGAAAAGLAVMGRTVAPQVLDDIVPRNARLGQLSRVGEVPADIPPSLFDIERSRLGRAAFRERSPADAGAASPAPAEQFGAGVAAGALGGWGAAELIDPYVETPQEEEARWMREVMPYFELRQHALELRMQGVQSWEVSDPELAAELRALEEAEGVEGPRRLRPIQ